MAEVGISSFYLCRHWLIAQVNAVNRMTQGFSHNAYDGLGNCCERILRLRRRTSTLATSRSFSGSSAEETVPLFEKYLVYDHACVSRYIRWKLEYNSVI